MQDIGEWNWTFCFTGSIRTKTSHADAKPGYIHQSQFFNHF